MKLPAVQFTNAAMIYRLHLPIPEAETKLFMGLFIYTKRHASVLET